MRTKGNLALANNEDGDDKPKLKKNTGGRKSGGKSFDRFGQVDSRANASGNHQRARCQHESDF